LLLIAWVSFDLATPLPGAFEFEADDVQSWPPHRPAPAVLIAR
jgi:hypothetical protein